MQTKHLFPVALDCGQFVIRFGTLNGIENLENLVVLVLHVQEPHLLPFVFPNKVYQITTLLNLVQTLDEFVCEIINPVDELLLHLD